MDKHKKIPGTLKSVLGIHGKNESLSKD